jgi:hypothetical protein
VTVQEAQEALGVSAAVIYDCLADCRLTGRKVRIPPRTTRWEIDPESVTAEKERLERGAEPPNRYRPVFIRLPDEGMPFDPDERRVMIQRLRAEALAAQGD